MLVGKAGVDGDVAGLTLGACAPSSRLISMNAMTVPRPPRPHSRPRRGDAPRAFAHRLQRLFSPPWKQKADGGFPGRMLTLT